MCSIKVTSRSIDPWQSRNHAFPAEGYTHCWGLRWSLPSLRQVPASGGSTWRLQSDPEDSSNAAAALSSHLHRVCSRDVHVRVKVYFFTIQIVLVGPARLPLKQQSAYGYHWSLKFVSRRLERIGTSAQLILQKAIHCSLRVVLCP